MSAKKIVILHKNDNVGVAISKLEKGDKVQFKNTDIQVKSAIAFGHKIALSAIEKDKTVTKYGVTIGVATQNIACGEYVHVHNIKSQYGKQFTK